MEDRVTLSYFYGKEADQYTFYKIPKMLFTDVISIEYSDLKKVKGLGQGRDILCTLCG